MLKRVAEKVNYNPKSAKTQLGTHCTHTKPLPGSFVVFNVSLEKQPSQTTARGGADGAARPFPIGDKEWNKPKTEIAFSTNT
jgi:hypothetical protein